MELYGIAFDSGGYHATVLSALIAAISLFLVSRVLPEIRAAWEEANHAGGRR